MYKKVVPKSGKVRYGYITSQKAELMGAVREALDNGLYIYGQRTVDGLNCLEEDPDHEGKMEGEGDHFAVALGLACLGLKKYKRFAKELEVPPPPPRYKEGDFKITLDDILENLDKRKHTVRVFEKQVNPPTY
jgi:hypothetical protein